MSDIILRNINRDNCSLVLKLILEEDHSLLEKTIGFIPTVENIYTQTFEDPDYNTNLLIGAFSDNKSDCSLLTNSSAVNCSNTFAIISQVS